MDNWLRRYQPKLLSRGPDGAHMQVDYDKLFDIELKIKDKEYEVTARLAQEVSRQARAQNVAAKLSAGVQRAMEKQLYRGAVMRQAAR